MTSTLSLPVISSCRAEATTRAVSYTHLKRRLVQAIDAHLEERERSLAAQLQQKEKI